MNAQHWMAISLLLLAGHAPAQVRHGLLELGDARGGDCSLNYLVFDKVQRQHAHGQGLNHATPFLNDLCDIDRRIRIVANGEEETLLHVHGPITKNLSGSKAFYANERYTVLLEIGRPLSRKRDPETGCVETHFFARTTIGHAGKERIMDGTLTGGCP